MDIDSLPNDLKIGTKTGKPIANYSAVYKRLDRKKPSNTIVPGHNALPVHPTLDRTLTIREAARIQSFKDDFVLEGSRTSQYRQVGNAVPPLLAKVVAVELLKYFYIFT